MIPLANLGFLSPDSRCYPFDARANGYSRGEGFGIIIIKRIADAIADGDTIRAVIRGIGANQDGRTPGITQPNGSAQEALIRETYMKHDLDRGVTRFFEAHGTGTPVGDLVEARAISAAFRDARATNYPLFVGAAKSNVGHLEGASGIVSIIKATLALEKGIIPPNADYRYPNPDILAKQWNIEVTRDPTRLSSPASLTEVGSSHVEVYLGPHMASEEPLSIPLVMEVQMSMSSSTMLDITLRLGTYVANMQPCYHLRNLLQASRAGSVYQRHWNRWTIRFRGNYKHVDPSPVY